MGRVGWKSWRMSWEMKVGRSFNLRSLPKRLRECGSVLWLVESERVLGLDVGF